MMNKQTNVFEAIIEKNDSGAEIPEPWVVTAESGNENDSPDFSHANTLD